jgi:LysE type translocator
MLLVVPGPAVLYIVARSIDHGRRAGLMSVLGVAVGSMFHVTAAAGTFGPAGFIYRRIREREICRHCVFDLPGRAEIRET